MDGPAVVGYTVGDTEGIADGVDGPAVGIIVGFDGEYEGIFVGGDDGVYTIAVLDGKAVGAREVTDLTNNK